MDRRLNRPQSIYSDRQPIFTNNSDDSSMNPHHNGSFGDVKMDGLEHAITSKGIPRNSIKRNSSGYYGGNSPDHKSGKGTANMNDSTTVHFKDGSAKLLVDNDKELEEVPDEKGLDIVVEEDTEARDAWGSKVEFMLASIGLAVGVGNVWRFPYLCQKNGGGRYFEERREYSAFSYPTPILHGLLRIPKSDDVIVIHYENLLCCILGAFLIPYFTMMLIEGMPLFVMEYALGQRMKQSAVRCWNNVHPAFFGLGLSCMLVSFAMCLYYIVIITWCVYYFFVSFTSSLPWQKELCPQYDAYSAIVANLSYAEKMHKDNPTNFTLANKLLLKAREQNFSDCCVRDPSMHYWYRTALNVSPEMSDAGGLNWKLTGCLVVAWIITYLCVIKGVKSSGKVVYFTATFPYIILFILFIRGVTLEGADIGIKAFFTPDWSYVWNARAWMDAATQMFYSLSVGFGALIAFASYMPRKNNCNRDAIIVVLTNCGTSLFAGIVVFSFLGHRQFKTGVPVTEISSGPGLAFMTFTEAFLLMDVSPLWSVMFFFMLLLLGIDSQFGTLEGAVQPLYDMRWVTMRKEFFMAIVSVVLFAVEISLTTGTGYYLFQVFDDYSVPYPLLIISMFQVIALGWFYGTDRFGNDMEYMTGKRPWFFWNLCWKYISPIVMLFVFIATIIQAAQNSPTYQIYVGCIQDPLTSDRPGTKTWTDRAVYPGWAQFLAVMLVLISVCPIPFFIIKNWPANWVDGFKRKFLSGRVNYMLDPIHGDPSRYVSPAEMEKIVREEDLVTLREQMND